MELRYKFNICSTFESQLREQTVCKKASNAIHGISKKKIEYLFKALILTELSRQDKRGRHGNRPHTLTLGEVNSVKSHISPFQGRGSR